MFKLGKIYWEKLIGKNGLGTTTLTYDKLNRYVNNIPFLKKITHPPTTQPYFVTEA